MTVKFLFLLIYKICKWSTKKFLIFPSSNFRWLMLIYTKNQQMQVDFWFVKWRIWNNYFKCDVFRQQFVPILFWNILLRTPFKFLIALESIPMGHLWNETYFHETLIQIYLQDFGNLKFIGWTFKLGFVGLDWKTKYYFFRYDLRIFFWSI